MAEETKSRVETGFEVESEILGRNMSAEQLESGVQSSILDPFVGGMGFDDDKGSGGERGDWD